MDKRKYHVFFRRVSTKGQDLAMQIQADAPFREKLLPEEIKVFNEDALSANKVRLEDRDELLEVISLIKQGVVNTIYAFDDSRLFRDTYEGNYFNELQRRYGFDIFYTKDHQLMSDNFLFAGMSILMSDIEGKNIARRTEAARRMYPAQKFGYIKIREPKQYKQNPKVKDILHQYFQTLPEVTDYDEMFELLTEYSKKLNRSKEELIKYARDPFYAGYDLSKGENKLHHVDAYLDLETFFSIALATSELFEKYLSLVEKLHSTDQFIPLCGLCHRPMNFRIEEENNTSFYTCSRGHKRNRISATDLKGAIEKVLQDVVTHLDASSLLKQSKLFFQTTKKDVEKDLKSIELNTERLMHDYLKHEYNSNWKEDPNYQKLIQLKEKEEYHLEKLLTAENHLQKNKEIINKVKDFLSKQVKSSVSTLSPLFINKIVVEQNEIRAELLMSDYLKAIDEEFIYSGSDSA